MQEENEREGQLIGDSKKDDKKKPRRVSLDSITQENEKPFIQEKVNNSKRKKTKGRKLITSLGTALLAGVVFGVAACAGFFAAEPYIKGYFDSGSDSETPEDFYFPDNRDEELATPSKASVDTPSPGAVASETEVTKPNNNKGNKTDLSIKDYSKLSSQFSEYAAKMEKSVLTVTSVKEGKDIFDYTEITSNSFYGLVLGEYGKKIILLSPYGKIKENNKIMVTFPDGLTLEAELISADSELGIAILGILLEKIPDEVYNDIEPAKLGESYYLSVGNPVMALGSPNGYMYSRLLGNVSTKSYVKYIQDGRVSLFNTDMPLYEQGEAFIVNLNGEVVGFLTKDFPDDMNQDMCVVMGISYIKKNIEDLINVKDRPYFGVMAWDMTKESLETLEQENGIYVSEVIPDSPAYGAGIINGDVIIRVGEKDVSSVEEFHNILRTKIPEDEVKVVLLRTAKSGAPEMTVSVILKKKE